MKEIVSFPFSVNLDEAGHVHICGPGLESLMIIRPYDWIVAQTRQVKVYKRLAWETYHERHVTRIRVHSIRQLGPSHFQLLDAASRPLANVMFQPGPHGSLDMQADACRSDVNRLGFYWQGPPGEQLLGFGEYGDGPQRTSRRWSTWVEEGPVGLGPLSPWLGWTGRVPLPKGHNTTPISVPSWLSTAGYAAWLDNTERIDWAMKDTRRMMKVWSGQFSFHMVWGPSIKEAILHRSRIIGQPPRVPPWVLFPWSDAVRGQGEVLRVARQLRNAHIPSTAIWVEDWMGSWEDSRRFWQRPLSHRINRDLYPDPRAMSEELHAHGYKLLGYFCPEIALGTPLYEEARKNNYLVRDKTGKPVTIVILGHPHGEPDLTNPHVREWIKDSWLAPMESLGFDGWMADFGEYLPVTGVLYDGSSGYTTHNRYPILWQSLHREFWDSARPNGDYTFFVRSGGQGSSAVAPSTWGGDSDTDWGAADGLATVIPQALSAGLMGHAIWGTDIAGYMTMGLTRPVTKELFIRWTQAAALLPLMRTHHGMARPRNWQWWRDAQTRAIYGRYCRLHALLFPYFYTFAEEAHATGLPLIRPLCLEFPGEAEPALNTQFLLGESLLAAPVVRPKSRQQLLRLPPGDWIDWWSGHRFRGPARIKVPAPLDRLPLYIRDNTLLPLLEGPPGPDGVTPGFVESLADANADALIGRHLTILRCGDLPEATVVSLPWGVLRVVAENINPSVTTTPQLPPRTVDHAPLLGRVGKTVTLLPQRSTRLDGARWTWEGSAPLELILRRHYGVPMTTAVYPGNGMGG